ncbi:MAG: hypothetical protein ABIG44_00055 [Planctomycetota bacterium]
MKLDDTGSNLIYSFLHQTVTPSLAYVAATEDTLSMLVVLKLGERSGALTGDLNCSGSVNSYDIDGLIALLGAG